MFHGLVNYGTQAGVFSKELRKVGIESLSLTNPDKFKRQTDKELLYGGNFIEKIYKHFINNILKIKCFFKFNTFHFYFGETLFPKQLDLPFYRMFGKKVVMEYLGYDVQLYRYSLEKYKYTNVKFYKSADESIELDKIKTRRLQKETKYIDKQLVCAPYLSEFVPKSEVLPLAVDLDNFQFSPKDSDLQKLRIMHAPTSRDNKGTSFILSALKRLISEGHKIEIDLVENVTHEELKKRYTQCDIFIDQILGGWYGTASIEAMAIGRPTVCFIRESYFEHINYGEHIPIINATPETLYNILDDLLNNKNTLKDIGLKSRKFVENIHGSIPVTEKLVGIYNDIHL